MARNKRDIELTNLPESSPPPIRKAFLSVINRGCYEHVIKLKPHQSKIIKALEEIWEIDIHWVAYYRLPGVQINRKPFNTPVWKDRKSFGKFYSAQLNLTIGVFERVKPSSYSTPLEWWTAQLLDLKRCQTEAILQEEMSPESKRETVSFMRKELKILKGQLGNKETIEELLSIYPPEEGRLLQQAIKLADRRTKDGRRFIAQYWTPYLETLREKIEALHSNSGIQIGWHQNGQVLMTAKHSPKPLKRS